MYNILRIRGATHSFRTQNAHGMERDCTHRTRLHTELHAPNADCTLPHARPHAPHDAARFRTQHRMLLHAATRSTALYCTHRMRTARTAHSVLDARERERKSIVYLSFSNDVRKCSLSLPLIVHCILGAECSVRCSAQNPSARSTARIAHVPHAPHVLK